MKVFVSETIGAERLVFGATQPPGNARSRRWRYLAELYRDGLAASGYDTQPILRPEIYQTDVARRACGAEPDDWHLAVKPLEHLRPFHGLPNIFVCDWGYSALSKAGGSGAPFLHHVRLLGRAQVVACCTQATLRAVQEAGVDHAIVWPPFVGSVAELPAGPVDSGLDCTFLAVMDAEDPADSWASLLQGFMAALAEYDRIHLTVAIDGVASVEPLKGAMLARAGIDNPAGAVSFVAAPLREAIRRMAPRATFLLDPAPVGGLPIASVEAALAGLPLVVARTAWFPVPDAAQVPIATLTQVVDPADEPAASIMSLAREQPDAQGIRDAVLAAAALSPSARQTMADAAQRFAERHFGLAAFKAAMDRLPDFHPGSSA